MYLISAHTQTLNEYPDAKNTFEYQIMNEYLNGVNIRIIFLLFLNLC